MIPPTGGNCDLSTPSGATGSSNGKGQSSGFGGEGDAGGFVDPTDCAITCAGTAENGCNLGDTTNACLAFCAKSPTQSQLGCFTSSPCTQVASALDGKSVICGIVGPPDGGLPPNLPAPSLGGPVVDPTDCAITCEGIAENGCNFGDASSACVAFCANSPTQGQMACFSDAPCSEVVDALMNGTPICGIGR